MVLLVGLFALYITLQFTRFVNCTCCCL